MKLIAHRGHSELHSDNSKKAFQSACDFNFDMIELDIQISKDSQIFIHHDTFIGSFLLHELTFSEIKKMNQEILLLDEFFEIVNLATIQVYLDVKGNTCTIVPILHELLKKHQHNFHNLYIGSFNSLVLEELSILNSCYNLGFITENLFSHDFLHELISKYRLKFISFHWTMLREDTLAWLKTKNVEIFTYTCKNENIHLFMQKYKNVDGIVSNYKF